MSETKWTPGPWWPANHPFDMRCATIFIRSGSRVNIAAVSDGKQPEKEDVANASLIAAAPDLFEALALLQGFGWQVDDSPHGEEIKRRALAAMAKARGA